MKLSRKRTEVRERNDFFARFWRQNCVDINLAPKAGSRNNKRASEDELSSSGRVAIA